LLIDIFVKKRKIKNKKIGTAEKIVKMMVRILFSYV